MTTSPTRILVLSRYVVNDYDFKCLFCEVHRRLFNICMGRYKNTKAYYDGSIALFNTHLKYAMQFAQYQTKAFAFKNHGTIL